MSATRPSRESSGTLGGVAGPVRRDPAHLRARRREARRRQRLARVDLGIGLFTALILLIATPGLAITGLIAGLLLVLAVGSVMLERRRAARAAGAAAPPHALPEHAERETARTRRAPRRPERH